MVYLGSHCSIANGLMSSIKYIESIGGNALQIFLGSNRSGNLKLKSKISEEEIREVNKYLKEKDILLVVHGIYLLNFCKKPPSSGAIKYQLDNLIYDLSMVDKIGGIGVVIHLGSQLELSKEEAYNNMINNLIFCIQATKNLKVKIILETPAGQGSQIATTLEEFTEFYNNTKLKKYHNRLGICVDTCHIFAAGHDISSQEKMKIYFKEFDKKIGLKNLTCIHLNDSMVQYNAHKDRHQNIARGYLFNKDLGGDYNSLRVLTDISSKYNIPLILETPGDGAPPTKKEIETPNGIGSYQYEIRLIKKFLKESDIKKFPKERVDYVPLYFKYLKDKSKSLPKTIKPNFEQTTFKQTSSKSSKFPQYIGGGSIASENEPNKTIINIIQKLESYYLQKKDVFRYRAYSNALLTLKKYPKKITKNNLEELKEKNGIGKAIYEKIEEIINTGKLAFLDELEPITETQKNKNQLESILGFGPSFVSKLIKGNIKDIETLRTAVKNGKIKLNEQQDIGLKYHEELHQLIPRKDAHDIVNKIALIAKNIFPHIKVVHAGSYPSGKKASKDIDILITDPMLKVRDDLEKYNILEILIKELEKQNIIEAQLSLGYTKFLGIVKGTSKSPFVKHLDIRVVPKESWITAYLYFTSGQKFNTMSRAIAKKNGMTLNEWGLFDKYKNRILTPTEEDVFKKIGLEFIPMKNRR